MDWEKLPREALLAEIKRLGNELARERAKPGGAWDHAAYEQLAEQTEELRIQMADVETRLIRGVGGEFVPVRGADGELHYESTPEGSQLSEGSLDAIRRRLEAMPPRGFQPAVRDQVVALYRDLAVLLREVYRLRDIPEKRAI